MSISSGSSSHCTCMPSSTAISIAAACSGVTPGGRRSAYSAANPAAIERLNSE
jgi:hypothetical protein